MTSRPSTAAPILAVLAIVLVALFGAYVATYVLLADRQTNGTGVVRFYSSDWEVTIFTPAARAESYLTGVEVTVMRPASFDELIDLITTTIAPNSSWREVR